MMSVDKVMLLRNENIEIVNLMDSIHNGIPLTEDQKKLGVKLCCDKINEIADALIEGAVK